MEVISPWYSVLFSRRFFCIEGKNIANRSRNKNFLSNRAHLLHQRISTLYNEYIIFSDRTQFESSIFLFLHPKHFHNRSHFPLKHEISISRVRDGEGGLIKSLNWLAEGEEECNSQSVHVENEVESP